MMYFKECPKCHGDLIAGEDMHGRYLSCIQCGYMRDLPGEQSMEKPWSTADTIAGKVFVIDARKTAKKRQKKVRQAA